MLSSQPKLAEPRSSDFLMFCIAFHRVLVELLPYVFSTLVDTMARSPTVCRQMGNNRWTSSAFSFPIPAVGHVFHGFRYLGIILVTAIPFGIYDLVEAMDNVESAAAAGDSFPTTRVLSADGVISLIGCLLGNPFINAVYIGHPGWKAMGGRIGYSAATGVVVLVLHLARDRRPRVEPYPGRRDPADPALHRDADRVTGFPGVAEAHAPAIILAMIPQIAAWGKTMIDGALGAAGTNAATVGMAKLGAVGILYNGLGTLGGGATLAGIILGAVTVFIIDRQLEKAAAFALAGSLLTFFGFIHGEEIGVAQSPVVALAYLGVAVMLFAFDRYAHIAPAAPPEEHEHGKLEAQPAE